MLPIIADIYIEYHKPGGSTSKLTVQKKDNKHRISVVPYSMYLSSMIYFTQLLFENYSQFSKSLEDLQSSKHNETKAKKYICIRLNGALIRAEQLSFVQKCVRMEAGETVCLRTWILIAHVV